MASLSHSSSQPHLQGYREPRTPQHLSNLSSSREPPGSGPAQLRAPFNGGGRGGGNNGGGGLNRSCSATTIGSIPEEEPYSLAAAARCCSAELPSSSSSLGASYMPPAPRQPSSAFTRPVRSSLRKPPAPSNVPVRPAPSVAGASGNSGIADAVLAQHAGRAQAPPAWVVRAMRSLEESYEKKLREAREQVVRAEEMAREASIGVHAVDRTAAIESALAASSVDRASAATEMAARTEYAAQSENNILRHAAAEAQWARGEAEARVVQREHEIRQLEQKLHEATRRAHIVEEQAHYERGRANKAELELEALRDESGTTRSSLERASAEVARLNEEAERLREHSRELAQGPAARPRPGGAPQPPAMGSVAEWTALREERDALVHLLVEMRKASEKAPPSRSVRVGGGFQQLPEYLTRLTVPLPPELRMTGAPPPSHPSCDTSADEGINAATHRSLVRSASAHAMGRPGSGYTPRGTTPRGTSPRIAGPWHRAQTPRAALFGPGRPANVLVHQQPPPPPTRTPRSMTAA